MDEGRNIRSQMNYVLLFYFSVFLFISQQTVEINSISSLSLHRQLFLLRTERETWQIALSAYFLHANSSDRSISLTASKDAIKDEWGKSRTERTERNVEGGRNRFDDVLLLSIYRFDSISHPTSPFAFSLRLYHLISVVDASQRFGIYQSIFC